ncbi:Glutaredoxin [Cytospora mali]|uniref:Glutaredoxin n=1 Tax=Cytospora mali TaxID=578113 RepID=A0A194V0E1_CYTMA|nr:Glutaredoxin [Valsa mali var. pyri (nom. inval.)]
MDAATQKAKTLIEENPVMVFSKSYCPYCQASKKTLDKTGVKYTAYELDRESDGSDIQDALEKISSQRTVPNIFIGKEHIGGNSDLSALGSDKLKSKLQKVGAL